MKVSFMNITVADKRKSQRKTKTLKGIFIKTFMLKHLGNHSESIFKKDKYDIVSD